MITFMSNFAVPKFKLYWGYGANNGDLRGGSTGLPVDTQPNPLPYDQRNYRQHFLKWMNTAFGRLRMEWPFPSSVSRCIISFYARASQDVFYPADFIADSDFFALRDGWSSNARRVLALKFQRHPTIQTKAALQVRWGSSTQQSSSQGTTAAETANDFVTAREWMHIEILYEGGYFEIWVNGQKELQGSVPHSDIGAAGPQWESWFWPDCRWADMVVQTGQDAALLGRHRITHRFLNGDVVTSWNATTSNVLSGNPNSAYWHWLQLSERDGWPQFPSQYCDASSYVIPPDVETDDYEAYSVESGNPVGSVHAVCLNAYAIPLSSSSPGSLQLLLRRSQDGQTYLSPDLVVPPYVAGQTGRQRVQVLQWILPQDPSTGQSWREYELNGGVWQPGLRRGSGCYVTHLSLERLHASVGVGAGARYTVR